jgi:uncharacterized protein YlxW (UPF0749 family)
VRPEEAGRAPAQQAGETAGPAQPATADPVQAPAQPAEETAPPAEPAGESAPPEPDRAIKARLVGVWIAVLAALLGFALAVQVKSTESNSALPSARQEDLVRILDDLSAREDRLRREIGELERTRGDLTTGAAGADAALKEARRLTQQLGVLAGTVSATGPGVVVTITEGAKALPADTVLDAMEELRGAGAEAIQIGGREGGEVRVGTSTYFLDGDRGIIVDGTLLKGPYRIIAVGDQATLAAALNIPGGVVNTVEQAGAKTHVEQRSRVAVTALRPARTPQYARPVS